MSMQPDPQAFVDAPDPAAPESAAPVIPFGSRKSELEAAIASACSRIPPLWTLRNFVAVNPFMGFSELAFAEATAEVERLFHGRALMPVSFYREQHRRGRISDGELRSVAGQGAAELSRPELAAIDAEELVSELCSDSEAAGSAPPRVETLAEAIDREDGSDWSRIVVMEVARWCAGRFDAGQAAWKQPWRELPPYPAWRAAARIDRNPEILGISGFRDYVATLPDAPFAAIASVLTQLGVPSEQHADLLTRELASVAGWAGHAQLRAREAAFANRRDDALLHLLAIRLVFDGGLDRALGGRSALLRSRPAEPRAPVAAERGGSEQRLSDHERRLLWQRAYEACYRKGLLAQIAGARPSGASGDRPRLQAVFCIDVRSEVLRRHLETQSDAIQTVGFAGFFGVPIELLKAGSEQGSARCPVLIAPAYRVRERGPLGSDAEARFLRGRARHERWNALRKLSVGAYPLVETVGYFFGLRMVSDSLGWTRPREGGAFFGNAARRELAPAIDASGACAISLKEQVDLAESVLRNMGLTRDFAEVVLLCGHGSLSTNNPYASGLDCGACGGHSGEANARVAAMMLGSPAVRAGLADRGIPIPEDTVFVAGLHDTTRDTVTLFDDGALAPDLRAELEAWLSGACRGARAERAERLGEPAGTSLARRLRRRARDWSEVRPEWGLAGNAAFIAAPRERTRSLDLGGRAFLHDYDPAADPDGSVLELVLTAPLVVASWINLQYLASTTDNEVFGSGDKTLHNVVGRHGVMLGNRSDLRVGLPWQSVHDGQSFVHEPMRLTAVIRAPRAAIGRVLDAHPELRTTIRNGWLHLIAWDTEEDRFEQYVGGGEDRDWLPSRLG